MESVLWVCDVVAMVVLVAWSARRESVQQKDARRD